MNTGGNEASTLKVREWGVMAWGVGRRVPLYKLEGLERILSSPAGSGWGWAT